MRISCMNIQRLRRTIAELVAFLRPTNSTHWVERLTAIDRKLADPATVDIGRRELESCFGGMGSLNDLYFCDHNGNLPAGADPKVFNGHFDQIMDALFRENRLAGASLYQRLQWRYYEFRYRGDLSPRIKKSFA
jgi:hypothetical protein